MKKSVILSILGLVLLAVAVPGYLIFSNRLILRTPALYARNPMVFFAYGDVRYKKDPSDAEWKKATVGTTLPGGSVVETGPDSRTDIAFTNEMVIRVAENSRFVVNRADIKTKAMELQQGSIYGKFKREYQDQSIIVRTPTAVASVRGTELGFEMGEEDYSRLQNGEEQELKNIPDKKRTKSPARRSGKETPEVQPPGRIPVTSIYAISGIVEVGSASREDSKILLSYQTRTVVGEDLPPSNPDKIEEKKTESLRQVLNSIHMEQVLLITDKILFDFNSANLKKESNEELDRIAELLQDRKEKVRIEGHTDNLGRAHINQRLSLQRAEAIKKYLVEKGVDSRRLFVKGYGDSRPIVTNDSEQHRAQNRRVEFVIVQ